MGDAISFIDDRIDRSYSIGYNIRFDLHNRREAMIIHPIVRVEEEQFFWERMLYEK